MSLDDNKRNLMNCASTFPVDIWFEDSIKEFIQDRNRLDMLLREYKITWEQFIEKRNKLAGEGLLK